MSRLARIKIGKIIHNIISVIVGASDCLIQLISSYSSLYSPFSFYFFISILLFRLSVLFTDKPYSTFLFLLYIYSSFTRSYHLLSTRYFNFWPADFKLYSWSCIFFKSCFSYFYNYLFTDFYYLFFL